VRDETVSRTYAETLFALAERHEGHQAYGEALGVTIALINQDASVENFLDTPRISAADKKEVLRKAFEGEVPREFLNFLLLLVDKRRQSLLREIGPGSRARGTWTPSLRGSQRCWARPRSHTSA
jgi:F-type H+-transporting ATPase subunit delta